MLPPTILRCLPFPGTGMSLADSSGHTCRCLSQLPWVCGGLCWILLCNSLPSCWSGSSRACMQAFCFKVRCLLGCSRPLCCVAGAWPALSGAQPGHAANIAAEVQSVWRSLLTTGVEILFSVLWTAVAVATPTSLVRAGSGRAVI